MFEPIFSSRFVKLPSWIKGAPSFVNASHADDLYFIFGGGELAMPYPMTPEERNLSKVMMTAWTNFAKTGYVNIVSWSTRQGFVKWLRWNISGTSNLNCQFRTGSVVQLLINLAFEKQQIMINETL